MVPNAHPRLAFVILGIVLALFGLAGQAQSRPPSGIARLIAKADHLNDQCRGGSGDSPKTQYACDQRDVVHAQIERQGWCWGPKDAVGFEQRWIRCNENSADTATGTLKEPRRAGPIGFRWIDDQRVPGVFTVITITDEQVGVRQIDPTSACYGRTAFWGFITTNYESNRRPIARANACWVFDRGQILLELGQSFRKGEKAETYRLDIAQFKTSMDPQKGHALTVLDLPAGAR